MTDEQFDELWSKLGQIHMGVAFVLYAVLALLGLAIGSLLSWAIF
jgi:hypothetical protein